MLPCRRGGGAAGRWCVLEMFAETRGWDRLLHAQFEIKQGYQALVERAKACSPYVGMPPTSAVNARGVDLVRCLSPEAAATFAAQVFDADGTCRFRSLPTETVFTLLESVLAGPTHEAIISAFGTHYAVIFAGGDTALPHTSETTANQKLSFKWHADQGPFCHLKLLLYLDGPETHDGGTTFLERPFSNLLRHSGYFYCSIVKRLDDLAPLASEMGVGPLQERRLSPGAGEGALFEPTNILHKGVAPTFGRRRIFTIGLVPWITPWQQAFSRMEDYVRRNAAFDFP